MNTVIYYKEFIYVHILLCITKSQGNLILASIEHIFWELNKYIGNHLLVNGAYELYIVTYMCINIVLFSSI